MWLSSSLISHPSPAVALATYVGRLSPHPCTDGRSAIGLSRSVLHSAAVLLRLHLGVLDLDEGELRAESGPVGLSPTEVGVLAYLAQHDRAVSQEELLAEVWGYSAKVRSRTVRVTINRIRTKIERDPKAPEHLLTELGLGYRLEALVNATQLVGRTEDQRRLREAGRLVTVTGPGGVGKTSLVRDHVSLQTALWVDCQRAETAEQLVDCVVEALGLGLSPDPRLAIVRAQPALMVLDNLEQVDDPSPIASWTRGRVLITSRRSLGLPGEQVLPLKPLSGDDARALLSQRWVQAGGEALTDDQAGALVDRLGGLPLALELVSSWASLLGPDQVLERLEQGVAWVTDDRREDRHGSLLAVVEGSWALLSEPHRAVLAQLTAFVDAPRLSDAEAVVVPARGVLSALRRLRELGLLREDLSLPVPVREFASPRCPADALERHRSHFLTRAEALPGRGPDFRRTLSVLTRDRHELLAAHGRCADLGVRRRIVAALDPVLQYYGPNALAQELWREHGGVAYARCLRVAGRLEEGLAVARACGASQQLSRLLVMLGRPDEALAAADRAIEEAPGLVDRAECVTDRARLYRFRGEASRTTAELREALGLALRSRDTLVEAQVLCHLGEHLAMQVDREAADLLARGLALDPTPSVGVMLRARLAYALGRFDADADVDGLLSEAVDLSRQLGLLPAELDALLALGTHRVALGRLDDALTVLEELHRLADQGHHMQSLLTAQMACALAEAGRASESQAMEAATLGGSSLPFFRAWNRVVLALAAGFRGEDPLVHLRQAELAALAGIRVCHGLAQALIAALDPAEAVPEPIGDPEVDSVIALARARRGAPRPRKLWRSAAVRLVARSLPEA